MENLEIIKRKAVQIFSEKELDEKLNSGKKLIIKFGADPSRPDLHIGHSVPLRILKQFQDMGHQIVFVIGDFTAMIGDPSGKSKTRPALTYEETRKSAETYMQQVTKILDVNKTKIVFNSEWLSKMNFEDIIKLASKYTVARILERDDFKNRFENNLPLSMHELLYPLMQGYDSVALNADIEIGGTDQTFNLLVGRELQKDYGEDSQVVMTFPLLVGLDGKEKMSKSLDNYIGLTDTPFEKFEKSMKIPDSVLKQYFELATDIPQNEIDNIMNGDIIEAHFKFAKELLKMYDKEEDFEVVKQRYDKIAKGGIPENIKEIEILEDNMNICDLLVKISFASSKSEARRMITGRGVKINSIVKEDINELIDLSKEIVVQFGKNKFIKIIK
ncbi:MAG: tyrosine--tRNA ligase [Clostridiales bacterium]|nr:tyrosine--tRNA ligase [Clostridiales bacterium]